MIAFKLNAAKSTVSVKFEDSEIGIDKIAKRIEKGRFQVKDMVEVSATGDNP